MDGNRLRRQNRRAGTGEHAADELFRALLEELMTGRVGVDLQGLQAETELP